MDRKKLENEREGFIRQLILAKTVIMKLEAELYHNENVLKKVVNSYEDLETNFLKYIYKTNNWIWHDDPTKRKPFVEIKHNGKDFTVINPDDSIFSIQEVIKYNVKKIERLLGEKL